jgi:hypothetical protein
MKESKRKTISIDVYIYTTNLEVLIVVLNNNPNNLNTSKINNRLQKSPTTKYFNSYKYHQSMYLIN